MGSATGCLTWETEWMKPFQTDRGSLTFTSLVLTGNFHYPSICWMDRTVGHRQTRNFLECIDNFILQVIEVPRRRGAVLNFVLPNKEMLVGNVKLKGSLCCSDHGMMKFL